VSQTEGVPLPDFSERVKGEVGEYRERLIDFLIAQGIALEFKESIAPALGMSYGGRIAVLPGQAAAEEFSTLVHELAHEMFHKAERRTARGHLRYTFMVSPVPRRRQDREVRLAFKPPHVLFLAIDGWRID
jgi:hypothetical protein